MRPVKPGINLVIAYPTSGTCLLHAEGCNHLNRKSVREAQPIQYDSEGTYEDWYPVAPCAAAGKGLVCTAGGCSVCEGHSDYKTAK